MPFTKMSRTSNINHNYQDKLKDKELQHNRTTIQQTSFSSYPSNQPMMLQH